MDGLDPLTAIALVRERARKRRMRRLRDSRTGRESSGLEARSDSPGPGTSAGGGASPSGSRSRLHARALPVGGDAGGFDGVSEVLRSRPANERTTPTSGGASGGTERSRLMARFASPAVPARSLVTSGGVVPGLPGTTSSSVSPSLPGPHVPSLPLPTHARTTSGGSVSSPALPGSRSFRGVPASSERSRGALHPQMHGSSSPLEPPSATSTTTTTHARSSSGSGGQVPPVGVVS